MGNRATLLQAIEARHSVRSFKSDPIEADVRSVLEAEIERVNAEGNLHLQLICDEPEAFSGAMAKYGKFSGVRNYIACVGKKAPDLDKRVGYFGEQVVLCAQQLGLNSCWVGLTFSKGKCAAQVAPGEKLVIVIALGYGTTQGIGHKVKPISSLCRVEGRAVGESEDGVEGGSEGGTEGGAAVASVAAGAEANDLPDWFIAGMKAAQLAPTAMNQQKFLFTLEPDGSVSSKSTGGFFSKVDLGIVRCHFEIGAGKTI